MSLFAKRAPAATAVLYLTHFWSAAQRARFLRLHRALPRGFDLYLLLDAADPQAVAAWQRDLAAAGLEAALATFDKDEVLQRLGHPPYHRGMTRGSMHFPVIAFARDHPGYRLFWTIESDVHIAAWGRFLRAFRRSEADLLISHYSGYREVPGWRHWESLVAPEGTRIAWDGGAGVQPVRGFFPVFRISKEALACLDAGHAAGWQGQCEAVSPTILKAAGYRIEDLNDWGRFYTSGPTGPRDGKPPHSSLRWSPPIAPEEISRLRRTRIYHPVKE